MDINLKSISDVEAHKSLGLFLFFTAIVAPPTLAYHLLERPIGGSLLAEMILSCCAGATITAASAAMVLFVTRALEVRVRLHVAGGFAVSVGAVFSICVQLVALAFASFLYWGGKSFSAFFWVAVILTSCWILFLMLVVIFGRPEDSASQTQ